MESRKRPIDELLEDVRSMRSNLERMNRDIAFIKNKIKEKEDKDKAEFESDKVVETNYYWWSR